MHFFVREILDPAIDHPAALRAQRLVAQLKAEARSRKTERPDLGVLAVRSVPDTRPLVREELIDLSVRPRKRLVFEPGDFERFVPRVGARDVAIDREHQIEEAAEEQVAFGADWIR